MEKEESRIDKVREGEREDNLLLEVTCEEG